MSNKITGYTLYDGPSLLDGSPIVAILTLSSVNAKTADMAQLWILPKETSPSDAIHTGSDASVCGNCKHRGSIVDGRNTGRTCYVLPFQAPRSVYAAWTRGRYPVISLQNACKAIANRPVRLGAYGDPSAIPVAISALLTVNASKSTGYTHQWRTTPNLRPFTMASVDTEPEARDARASGWRYFRVSPDARLLPGEMLCPASKEAGQKTTCDKCGLCNGARPNDRRKNVVILAHGAGASKFIALAEIR